MTKREIGRREFVQKGSALVAAAATTGNASNLLGADPAKIDTSKIVNYNSEMRYRRLGKSNLMISEVSLGGHWVNRGGENCWDTFAKDEVPDDVAKNRTDVISACIEVGINYLDITTAAECLSYGIALKGRRDKMIVGADDHRLGPRNPANCNVKALLYNLDECLRRLQTDYLVIWRIQADMAGKNTDADVEVMVEAFQVAHKAGKAKHFGVSTHNRPWAQHVIENFKEVEMFIFPCTAKTIDKTKPVTKDNVAEGTAYFDADQTQSIFASLKKNDVGLVTIKPFNGGSLFTKPSKFPVLGVGDKQQNDLARLTLQCILTNDQITATVPGLSTIYEVENAARASYTRPIAMTPREKEWLARVTEERWAALPEEYQWLREWEAV